MYNPDILIPVAKNYQDDLQKAAQQHQLVESLSSSNRQTIKQNLYHLWHKLGKQVQKPVVTNRYQAVEENCHAV